VLVLRMRWCCSAQQKCKKQHTHDACATVLFLGEKKNIKMHHHRFPDRQSI
jgi:hypothetical protein